MSRNMARRLSGRIGDPSLEPPLPPPDYSDEVNERISAMSFTELRGLSYDYRDLIQGKPHDPGSFKEWLLDRVEDQLIAKQYDDEREWF